MRLLEVHLEVSDVAHSLKFYSQLLPHRKVDSWDEGSAAALVLDDGSAFGLWVKGKRGTHGGRGGEHVHFAFQIRPDEYEHYNTKLHSLGMKTQEHTWPNGQRSVYFADYDGHQGEFMTVDWLGITN